MELTILYADSILVLSGVFRAVKLKVGPEVKLDGKIPHAIIRSLALVVVIVGAVRVAEVPFLELD